MCQIVDRDQLLVNTSLYVVFIFLLGTICSIIVFGDIEGDKVD